MTALDFPDSPSAGDLFPDPAIDGIAQWQWDGEKWIAAPPEVTIREIVPNHGRLIYDSPTHVRFIPYNGNKIKINGTIYTIPDAGIPYALVLHGVQYIYLRENMTMNERAWNWSGATPENPPHRPDISPGNIGVQVGYTPGNNSFQSYDSLVGMVYTPAQGIWAGPLADTPTQRHVASWFNRQNKELTAGGTYAFGPGISPDFSSFLCWGDESVAALWRVTAIWETASAFLAYDANINNRFGIGQTIPYTGPLLEYPRIGGFQQLSEGRHTLHFAVSNAAQANASSDVPSFTHI